MEPWEWDAWRAYWRARPREDVYAAAAIICCAIERAMVGGDPKIEDYYPKVERVRKGRRADLDLAAAALDRAFGV